MLKVLTIAQMYIYISLRTPITLIMAFVMPIVFTAVLGAALGGGGSVSDSRVPILLVNEDGGAIANEVELALTDSEIIRLFVDEADNSIPDTQAEALTAIDTYERILILPADFSENLLAARSVTAQFYVTESNVQTTAAEREIIFILEQVGALINVANIVTNQARRIEPFTSPEAEQVYFKAALAQAQEMLSRNTGGVVREVANQVGNDNDTIQNRIPQGNNQSSPGNLVMFGLVTLLSSAIVLVEERNDGTLRRLVVSPLSKSTILTGKTLGPFIIGILQMGVLILVGQLVFGVQWGRSPVALLIMVLTFDLAVVSLGIFLSTLVKTTEQAVGIMVGVSMVMASLGGAWWPIDIVPPFMRMIGHLFPSAWAMEGFQDIILRGAGVSAVATPALVLLGFAIFFFSLGVWRFRYE